MASDFTPYTVTVYACALPSSAVTVYVTAFVKLFSVVPLVCAVLPTVTLALSLHVNVATSAVTVVPYGTITATVCALWSIVPTTSTDSALFALSVKPNESSCFSLDCVSLLLPLFLKSSMT